MIGQLKVIDNPEYPDVLLGVEVNGLFKPFFTGYRGLSRSEQSKVSEALSGTLKQYSAVMAAIRYARLQRADDQCWMDIDKIYEAAGFTEKDFCVGDQLAMLGNCVRFVKQCTKPGGGWKSYAELEAAIRDKDREIEVLKSALQSKTQVIEQLLGQDTKYKKQMESTASTLKQILREIE